MKPFREESKHIPNGSLVGPDGYTKAQEELQEMCNEVLKRALAEQELLVAQAFMYDPRPWKWTLIQQSDGFDLRFRIEYNPNGIGPGEESLESSNL